MIVKEEAPDGGQVAIDRGTTIGYFSQDVGEMSGQSVVAATLDGAGPVSSVAARLRELEEKLADFRRRHPGIKLQLFDTVSEPNLDLVRSGAVDFGRMEV